MKFPITKAEFLAWCRENPDEEVVTWHSGRCLIARASGGRQGWVWPEWAEVVGCCFDSLSVGTEQRTTTVRTALRELAEAGVPGFTKKELREAAGLEAE